MRQIPLGGKQARGRMALVDDADYELVMQLTWHVREEPQRRGEKTNGPYAIARPAGGSRYIRMHSLLTGWTETDHKDGDGLNNQRSNLRETTHAQNCANKGKYSNNKSGYKGVFWVTSRGKWRAKITPLGRQITLGDYDDPAEAARAYDSAAVAHFGEFARLNFPGEHGKER